MANLAQEFREAERSAQRAVVVSELNDDRSAGRRTRRSAKESGDADDLSGVCW
jgi:hypothetical protein